MKRVTFSLVGLILSIAWIAQLAMPQPAYAAGVVGNGSPGSCNEAALDAALSSGGGISFNCGPNPHTIPITTEKLILSPTTLSGGNRITLDGGGTTRLFSVNPLAALELRDITLTKGYADPGGGVYNEGVLILRNSAMTYHLTGSQGGAIYNNGSTTIVNSTLSNNTAGASFAGGVFNDENGTLILNGSSLTENLGGLAAGGILNRGTASVRNTIFNSNRGTYGGGILNYGALVVESSTFLENSTLMSGSAGALHNEASGHEVVISDSTFVNNSSPDSFGGAITNYSPLTLDGNLFYGNSANTYGGAIYNYSNGTIHVSSNTFSENTAASGGGIYSLGAAYITNSTLSENNAGGLVNAGTGTMEALNTLLAFNSSYNCAGTITSAGYNMEDWETCGFTSTGDLKVSDPRIGPLTDNGGSTLTYALLPESPAINAGTNQGCPSTDQRGVLRPLFGTCDIGAYEFEGMQLFLPFTGKH